MLAPHRFKAWPAGLTTLVATTIASAAPEPQASVMATATASTSGSAAPTASPSAPPGASACTDKPEVCGRRAFAEGVSAFQGGDFRTAEARFADALAYKWHPAIALNLALAEAAGGHPVAAIRNLDAVLTSADTSAALLAQAKRERERAQDELAVIELDAGTGTGATLRVDGSVAEVTHPLEVDPGPHRIELTLSSGASMQRDVELEPREHLRLSVDRTHELVVLPGGQQARPAVTPSADAPRPPSESPRGVAPVWFYLSAGATAVLGGVTIWSALDTRAAHDDYERALPTASQADVDRRVDAGHALETRTNVLLTATGVAALGTAALGVFFVKWGPTPTSSVLAGPGNLGFRTSF